MLAINSWSYFISSACLAACSVAACSSDSATILTFLPRFWSFSSKASTVSSFIVSRLSLPPILSWEPCLWILSAASIYSDESSGSAFFYFGAFTFSCFYGDGAPPCSSMAFNRFISSSYYFRRASFGSSLTRGLFLMALAREAYLSVDKVSSRL